MVRQIIQLLGCQFWQRTERIDLSLECQLSNIYKPVAVVVLPMDAKRRTNTIAERSWCKRVLLRENLYSLFREP